MLGIFQESLCTVVCLADVAPAESGMLGIAFSGMLCIRLIRWCAWCSDEKPDRRAQSGGSTKS